MGVNFYLDIEGWDPYTNGGMKEIFRDNTGKFPLKQTDEVEDVVFGVPTYKPYYRPENIPLWRENLKILFDDAEVNLAMWLKAMDACERDPSLYFFVSY